LEFRPREMIQMKRVLCTVLALAALVALGCEDSGVVRNGVPQNEATTPRDNEEAELAALWLSGDLVAPQDLYQRIKRDLARIRQEHSDLETMASIEFMPPWVPSQLLTRFTPEGVEKIRDGDYPELELLNARFGLTRLDTISLWRMGTAIMEFYGRKHPLALGAPYVALDDVMWAEPNHYVGDWSCVYPWPIDGGMSYLVRHGSGDCLAGCINNIFWYFRVDDDEVEYVGRYEMWVEPEPVWWNEAKTAFWAYRGHER
jgi:hypothetical protein